MKLKELKYKPKSRVKMIKNLQIDAKYGGWSINSRGRMNYLSGKTVIIDRIVKKAIYKKDDKISTGKFNYGYLIKDKINIDGQMMNVEWHINDNMIEKEVKRGVM